MTRALAALRNAAAWVGNRALATALRERTVMRWANETGDES